MSAEFSVELDLIYNQLGVDLDRVAVGALDSILDDIEPYVPYNTGELNSSAVVDESSLSIVWEDEKADYVYNLPSDSNFNTGTHSLATSHWVEEALSVYRDSWVELIKKGFREV